MHLIVHIDDKDKSAIINVIYKKKVNPLSIYTKEFISYIRILGINYKNKSDLL